MAGELKHKWIPQRQAKSFVLRNHRHHQPPKGSITQLGLYFDGELVGVVFLGRTTSRRYGMQEVCEVTRLCTNGGSNGCSRLYGACARIAKELGFDKVITFILEDEDGASLK